MNKTLPAAEVQFDNVLLTGDELAEQKRQRAERLAELLRVQVDDPDELLS